MKWFEGSIPAAIQDAQSRKVVFVVYISGEDEQSKQMDETWANNEVAMAADEHELVALKLQANSQSCAQFSAIYPVVVVPCTYFISNQGTPLEIVGGQLPPADFLQKIDKAVKLHKEQLGGSTPQPPPAASSSSPLQEGATLQSADGATEEPEAKKAREDPMQERVDKAKDVLASSASQAAASGSSALSPAPKDLDDRVERAKALIAQKKEEKARKEAEEEKQKEVERRKVSQNMTRLRANKDEIEARELKEQMKKDREADKLARQRVKDQIARDRAERAEKFQKEKDEREQVTESAKEVKLAEKQEAERQAAAERSKHARIQFRLPDGSTLNQQFQATDTLDTAREYLIQEVGARLGSFRMTTTYPRREFTDEDMSQTMQELQLTPSAAIVVLPGTTKSMVRRPPSGGGGDSFIMMLLGPLIAIWNFIYNFLFASPPPQPSQQQQPQPVRTSAESSTAQAGPSQSRPKSPSSALGNKGYQSLRQRQVGGGGDGTVTTRLPQPLAVPQREPLSYLSDLVYFDLETTGLGYNAHITQLAALGPDGSTFNEYIFPQKPISPQAAEITGLCMQDGDLCHNGVPVSALGIITCLRKFSKWLNTYDRPTLVAHNCLNFDAKVFTNTLNCVGMTSEYMQCIIGFADSLPYFRAEHPGRHSYKQVVLAQEILGLTYDAHDALEDVKTLSKLVHVDDYPEKALLPYSFDLHYVILYLDYFYRKKANAKTLYCLVDGNVISKLTLDKMAAAGLTLALLQRTFQREGKRGLIELLKLTGKISGLGCDPQQVADFIAHDQLT